MNSWSLLRLLSIKSVMLSNHVILCHPSYCQSYSFSISYVWMWELDHKEGWVSKNWWFQTAVLEKTLESPSVARRLDQSILKDPKGNPPWIFIGRIGVEAEAPILWPSNVRSQHIGKNPDAGKDWGQEEKRATEDEMVGWHHRFNRHELKQTLWDNGGQGSLVCCSSWGWKELDMTQRLNNNNIISMELVRSELLFVQRTLGILWDHEGIRSRMSGCW